METVCLEIGINWQHVAETSQPQRYQIICDKKWLQTLEKKRKIDVFPVHPTLDRRAHPDGDLEHPWCRVLVQLYKKQPYSKVFPLKCPLDDSRTGDDFGQRTPLSYSMAVYEVMCENFRNLWSDFYKKCPGAHVKGEKDGGKGPNKLGTSTTATANLLPYDSVLKEVIYRVFKCPIIHCGLDRIRDDSADVKCEEVALDGHSNIMPALICIETSQYMAVLFYPPGLSTTLYDCITFSPAVLNKNYNKPLFIVYQLLQLFRSLHQQGLVLGELSLQDILLNENLWALVIPPVDANITAYFLEEVMTHSPSEATGLQELDLPVDGDTMDISNLKLDLKFSYDLKQFSLRDYCDMWCNGQISNFDYLTILNNAAGRSQNNPSYHHIMPWVTNFESRNGLQWRDLTKSKYRLNKGDIHLDLMFQHATQQAHRDLEANCSTSPQQVAHHVSDFLSEITYFVYMARRTPQQILREHVRPIWVPAEYPASIQRLQEWTPDECIPEFYTDPMIFKSIHEDLPDLEIPSWASCPEDFIAKHREALESQYVSERLHHWIDLNFGYKLSGKAAIKSKNVCLPMVDHHKTLCKRGIVQLFTHPHPGKRTISPWFSKQAPRIQNLFASQQQKPPTKHKSSKKLNKSLDNLSKSTESLDGQGDNVAHTAKVSPRLTLKLPEDSNSSSNFYKTTNFIELPKDYNPIMLLQSLESSQQFVSKTFPLQKPTENAPEKMLTSDLLFEDYTDNHSFTNHLFNEGDSPLDASSAKVKSKNFLASNKQPNKSMPLHVHHMKKLKDLQILGCLIVEMFAMPRIRPLIGHNLQPKFETRLKACLTINQLYRQDIPKCLRYITNILLNLTAQDVVTEKGMPLPSAGQLLEPIYHNLLIPFPTNFYATYALIRSLYSFDFAFILLELHTHFQCNGHECSRYTEIDRLRVQFERKIGKCKVMSCCAHIRRLLEPVGFEQFPPIDILLPHIVNLLTDEHTSILTAWNLFDAVAQALGIQNTQKYLLQPIMKLYDVESFERGMISVRNRSITDSLSSSSSTHLRFSTSSSFKSRKSVKLYHQIFLLRLIVRFGLKCFLQNFIAPLIEAVGGYKEPEDGNGLHYHSSAAGRRSSRNLCLVNNPTVVVNEDDMTLMSPQKAEDLEDNTLSQEVEASNLKPEIEDVFSFDDDANSDHISTSDHISNKSLDSFDMSQRPTTAEEAKEEEGEEEYERHLETTPEKLAISEIIYGSKISNNSFEEADKISLSSQNANDSPLHNSQLGPRSPTIAIPASVFRRSYQLNTIDCDIGSRKSVDSFEILQNAAEEEQKQIRAAARRLKQEKTGEGEDKKKSIEGEESTASKIPIEEEQPTRFSQEANDSLQASVISKMSEEKSLQNNCISEMSSISLIWLSHRLGPVLTSRYIAKNLLKMLTLCYVGQENLLPESGRANEDAQNLNYFTVSDARVVGDRSAVRVLECLMAIASLYGEQVILMQYFPHISELIALGVKRITSSLEGAIISTLQLVKYLIPCLTDATIMEHLKDILLDSIILPVLRFLGSAQVLMPSGYLGRSVLARKFLDAIYVLSVRLGPDMTREHLCLTVLRPFFLIFDKAFGETINFENNDNRTAKISPPNPERQQEAKREFEEICDVFSPALAHSAYLAFLRFLGEDIMKKTLLNLEFVLTLCHEFEQPDYKPYTINSRKSSDAVDCPTRADSLDANAETQAANSFGTQVVGNRIEVVNPTTQQTPKIISKEKIQPIDTMEVLDMVAYKFEHLPNTRYLKGNWLAYWRHEITRSEKDTTLSLQQIKLQSFVGHTNSVRAILALDNENSFISASKDKTVKLWSLRSEGDGFKTKSCQFTYTDHRKSIHSLAFLESLRFVVSCDSGVHIWDPFIGRPLGVLDSPKHNPITIVKCLPSPSPLVLAGTAEASVKLIDARCMQYVNEWRVSTNTQNNATVRCLTVAPSGNWLAVGLSSGYIVMLDTRTGMILNSWRRMECDILQLAAPNDQQLISSALDHSLAVWHAHDGNLHYQLVPPAEPAHFLQTNGPELVYATTGNRIGIYSDLSSSHASHTVTKLRSETFKGVLTSLAVLPLNRAFLAGNESGNISLLC
ncbi:WD repeat-containing protein 81 [Musca domestica]|uniref:WD repeat-containing protein 81 n=1 Tax=Musca domestica TaxID=7370 RepID=A0A1I8N3L5_MUSDO|nr:WD repeat-containing protein 81 [Musca domestica]